MPSLLLRHVDPSNATDFVGSCDETHLGKHGAEVVDLDSEGGDLGFDLFV